VVEQHRVQPLLEGGALFDQGLAQPHQHPQHPADAPVGSTPAAGGLAPAAPPAAGRRRGRSWPAAWATQGRGLGRLSQAGLPPNGLQFFDHEPPARAPPSRTPPGGRAAAPATSPVPPGSPACSGLAGLGRWPGRPSQR
jgi:hypothetical protein